METATANYFLVRCVGEYFIQSGTSHMLRTFDIELKLPQWDHALSLCRFHVLPMLIGKKDQSFQSIRRCVVVSITTKTGGPVAGLPVALQNHEQLRALVESNNISLDVDMYTDIIGLRGRVKFALAHPEQFEKEEVRKRKSYATLHTALDLNADAFNAVSIPEAEFKTTVEKDKKGEMLAGGPPPDTTSQSGDTTEEDTTPPTEPPVSEAGAAGTAKEDEEVDLGDFA